MLLIFHDRTPIALAAAIELPTKLPREFCLIGKSTVVKYVFTYSYETGNGISAHESGSPKAQGPEGLAVTAEGGFSYRAPDGQQITLTYTADENGFHPVGPHLPTPPPIPEEILRSIEFNKRNPSS
jgi:hypothetical protein